MSLIDSPVVYLPSELINTVGYLIDSHLPRVNFSSDRHGSYLFLNDIVLGVRLQYVKLGLQLLELDFSIRILFVD